MSKVYIFDVDGTLTPSRLMMSDKFKKFFIQWVKNNNFYLVTGSDLPKLQEQMDGMEIHSSGIFTCCGNQFWQSDPAVHPKHCDLIYENKFKPPENLLTYLGFQIKISDTPVHSTNHREDRGAMLNFSVVGRDCTLEERQQYFEWDKESGEREKIADEVRRGWPELDAVIGGQISIDIYPKGKDKSQILEHIGKRELEMARILDNLPPHNEYIFIGDGIEEGGNDFPLANLMDKTDDCSSYHTKGWEHTKEILESLND